ncbi:hypothetical protein GPJ56_010513 [Histomonas meleagridis]|uniref:uncharacterized protein n=1 Tax=Histomonas meleagridis TaxID=135588 RepID=UPI00355ABF6B|nr:hypothetical protein GPJ56_010513 [Histomonas meleagridis]KAH0799819.1 hypothetical protein GO595_007390 [Histomonas meleagridis]
MIGPDQISYKTKVERQLYIRIHRLPKPTLVSNFVTNKVLVTSPVGFNVEFIKQYLSQFGKVVSTKFQPSNTKLIVTYYDVRSAAQLVYYGPDFEISGYKLRYSFVDLSSHETLEKNCFSVYIKSPDEKVNLNLTKEEITSAMKSVGEVRQIVPINHNEFIIQFYDLRAVKRFYEDSNFIIGSVNCCVTPVSDKFLYCPNNDSNNEIITGETKLKWVN